MGREREVGGPGEARPAGPASQSPQFGWRAAEPVASFAATDESEHARPENGNGDPLGDLARDWESPAPEYRTTWPILIQRPGATATLDDPSETITVIREADAPGGDRPGRRPSGPSRRPGRRRGSPRFALHGLVLAVIVAVVLGHGYWNSGQQLVQPGGTDRVGDLRQIALPLGQSSSSSVGVGAATSSLPSGILTGYVSQFANAVVPEQLNIQTITTSGDQTIDDIATQTGRSVDTLLWANGLADPTKPLPDGTQVRVPPVDGMLHVVHDGDTLESIAARYQVKVADITGYAPNNVQSSADLVPSRLIMVPGGKIPTRDQVVLYTVRPGDSLAAIAQSFGLQPSTLVWANSLPNGDLIFPGQKLAILPTDGVMVTVKAGDTVESLAAHYNVEPKAIRDYASNGLGAGGHLRVGQQLMIPGGEPPSPPKPKPAPAQSAPVRQAAAPQSSSSAATGQFIWPTQGVITQYFGPTSLTLEPAYEGYAHFHQGLDIANNIGTPIVAAAAGTVIYAGWSNVGLGNCVGIDHGNGLVTWYGHMNQQPAVWVGEHVSQGQYLGPMGSTGASTGSHTHFAVLLNGVYVNPLNYLR